MPNNGYRFSEGFTVYREKVIKGGRKIADFKNSKWSLDKLNHEEEEDYLRILGICWASASNPRFTQMRFSITNEAIGQYLKSELGDEISIRPTEKCYRADLANPTFACSYVNLPHDIGPDQRYHILEGIITRSVGNAVWMEKKEPKETKKPVPPRVKHTKIFFKTANQDISNLVRLYASNGKNKMPWLPYDQMRKSGESHGTWFFDPEPLEPYVFLPELRGALGEMYAFPPDQLGLEISSLARAGLWEWGNAIGELSTDEYDEKKKLSTRIHNEAKAVRRERVALQKRLEEVRGGLHSLQDIESLDRMRMERDDYKKEIEILHKEEERLLEKVDKTNEEVVRLWREVHGRAPRRNGDTGYARRQWEHEKLK
ncbi:MAG TPA: hypothetical protein VJH90_01995 [archaeon]|nr:hypothetical protein [archaeon]